MTLVVVRHGESAWNKQNRFTGLADPNLSEDGYLEAERVGKILQNYDFDAVFSSKLSRAFITADNIIHSPESKCKTKIIQQADELNERNYGELTGKNKEQLTAEYGQEQITIWRRSYNVPPPGGENLHDVCNRVGPYFDANILPLLKDKKKVLVVAHGNSLRALFVHLGLKDEQSIETFEISTGVPIVINVETKLFRYENAFKLIPYQIIDSRGYPTLEVKCMDVVHNICVGKGSSPSGASCGSNEVLELRDGDPKLFLGKSVYTAVLNAHKLNEKLILNHTTATNLTHCDNQLLSIDRSKNKSDLGGNTTTAISFCMADVAARLSDMEIYEYIAKHYQFGSSNLKYMPTPFVNIINGGKHSVTGELKIQEFMIFTKHEIPTFKKIQIICEVYQHLQKLLVNNYGLSAKSIGDEGGFCPPIYTAQEALNIIEAAIKTANYIVNEDVYIALDCAASEFYNEETKRYEVERGLSLTSDQLIEYYGKLIKDHPALRSIEDGFHESDYSGWQKFTALYGDKIMIVGDDLFTTNPTLIKKGLEEKWANSLLLKVNQIGTITEAVEGAKIMLDAGKNVIVSHRSGETNHAFIVDIAIGIGAKYLKIGSPCRGERVAKFNRLLEIEASIE